MDIDELIKKYEHKAKLEKIAGGGLFKSKDYLKDLYQLKRNMIPCVDEEEKESMFRIIWNKVKEFLTLKR